MYFQYLSVPFFRNRLSLQLSELCRHEMLQMKTIIEVMGTADHLTIFRLIPSLQISDSIRISCNMSLFVSRSFGSSLYLVAGILREHSVTLFILYSYINLCIGYSLPPGFNLSSKAQMPIARRRRWRKQFLICVKALGVHPFSVSFLFINHFYLRSSLLT